MARCWPRVRLSHYDARRNCTCARLQGWQQRNAVDLVLTAAPDIGLYWHKDIASGRPVAPPMAFGSGMTEWLRRLSVCVIGVSGTRSIVAEQLARLSVGEITLICCDCMEERNRNRFLNSSLADCVRLKVDVFADSIRRHHPECHAVPVPH